MDKNPFPEMKFHPMERLKQVGAFVGRLLSPFHSEAPDYMSDHYRGAEAMLSDTEPTPLRPDAEHYVRMAQEARDLKKQEE